MTEEYMNGNTFAQELISYGVEIPNGALEIIIEAGAALEKTNIFFVVQDIKAAQATKVQGSFPVEQSSLDFFNNLRAKISLPDGTSTLVIQAKMGNDPVNIHLAAAFPKGVLSFIKVTEVTTEAA